MSLLTGSHSPVNVFNLSILGVARLVSAMGAARKGNRMSETCAIVATGRPAIAWRWRTARPGSESLRCLGHCAPDGLSVVGNLNLRQFAKRELRTEAIHADRPHTEAWAAVCDISR